jgi:hypothetical protein
MQTTDTEAEMLGGQKGQIFFVGYLMTCNDIV